MSEATYCADAQRWLLAWICQCSTDEVAAAVRTLRVVRVRPFAGRRWSSLRDLQRVAMHLGCTLERRPPTTWSIELARTRGIARIGTGPRTCELVGVEPLVGGPELWVPESVDDDHLSLHTVDEVMRVLGSDARWATLLETA